jgi:dihydroneopterin aldolase
MLTIHLHDLTFYSFHGIHEEERRLGNEYEVNADVQFHEDEAVDTLSQTINYVDVFDIIKKRMHIPTPLLETIVMDIGNAIREKYSHVRHIRISLKKKYPPVEGLQGSVGVTWHKDF